MKRFLIISMTLFSLLGISRAKEGTPISINKFGGIDTDNDALALQNGRTPDSQNVNTDETQGISPRLGLTSFSTETVSKGLWSFSPSNGTRYIITQSSNILKASVGGATFSTVISTVDPTVTAVATQLGDNWFFTNPTDGLKYWDSNSVFTGSTTIKCTQLVTWKGRLACSGISGKTRIIWLSRFLDGTFWNIVTNPADDDPAQLTVGGALDETITLLYSSFKDLLIWGKANSFGGVFGSRRPNFQVRTFSDVVGTSFPETVRDCNGELRFLGSKRIVWGFDGSNLVDLTRYKEGGGIRNLMNTVVQGDATTRVWTQTTQSDWSLGKSGLRISTNVTAGDVVFISTSFSDGFQGTCNSQGGSGGSFSCDTQWQVIDNNLRINGGVSGNPSGGMKAFSSIAVGTWTLTGSLAPAANGDASFYFLGLTTITVEAQSQGYRIEATESGGNTTYRIQYLNGPGGSNAVVVSSVVPNARALGVGSLTAVRTETGQFTLFIDSISAGSAVDTTFTSSTIITFQTTESSFKVKSISINENIMFSTFTSQEFNIGNKITSWGVVTINDSPGDASNKHVLFVANAPGINVFDKTTYSSSQTVTSNFIPTISTGQYVVVSSSFTRFFSTQTTSLQDFTIQWNEGSNLRSASIFTNQRYWLSVAVSSTANNTILVLDRNKEWQKYVGINADVMTTYNSNPMFGNASGVWQAESGNSDNSGNINAYFVSKTYLPSGPEYFSTFKDLFMTTTNNSATLSTTYQVDGVGTNYSLASRVMNAVSGYQSFNLPFASTNLLQGRAISFKWTVNSTVNWRIIDAELHYDSERLIHAN